MSKDVFGQKAARIPLWLLDTVIMMGIATMAILIVLAIIAG